MNLKTLIYFVIGISVFLGVYLFDMFYALTLLVGFGFGLLLNNYIKDIFKNFQKSVYLSEKSERENRKRQIQAELEQLNRGD